MVSAQARLEQVRYAVPHGLSQRRACALMRTARSRLYYNLRMPLKDAPVIEAMKDLSGNSRALAHGGSISSCRARAWKSARTAAAGSGVQRVGRCHHERSAGAVSPEPVHGHVAAGAQFGMVLRLCV